MIPSTEKEGKRKLFRTEEQLLSDQKSPVNASKQYEQIQTKICYNEISEH
jgi:hypothetical protein